MVDLRLPNITGDERKQLEQIRSYLYQLVPQLQHALSTIGTAEAQAVTPTPKIIVQTNAGGAGGSASPQSTFNSIKALIIKSADIVDAYYEEINKKLEGLYVSQSDFGSYAEKTSQEIEENSTSTTQRFENIQIIIANQDSNIASLEGSLETIGVDLSYTQNDIIKINTNIESLDSSIAYVEGEVGALDESLQSTKEELTGTINSTKEEISGTINSAKEELSGSINSTKEELSGTIESTKTELAGSINNTKEELSGNIENAKSELNDNIDNAKSDLNSNIDSAKNELNENISNATEIVNANVDAVRAEASAEIDSAKNELSSEIGATKSEIEGKIIDTNNRIDDTNGAVENLGVGLDDANKRIDSTESSLQDAKANLNGAIQRVTDSLSTTDKMLESAKAQLQGSIDDLKFYLSGLKETILGITAYIKSGLLYITDAGVPVYGIEIGQEVESNGEKVFKKFSRFTSEKLSFYDSNDIEVAYISDKKLYIGQAEITISFKVGGLIDLVMSNGDVVTKWEGGS